MKKFVKLILLLPLIFVWAESVKGQPVTWKKVYGTSAAEAGIAIQKTMDGGYIIAADYNNFVNLSKTYLLKLNRYGQKEWDKILNDTIGGERPVSVLQTEGNGYLIVTRYLTEKSRIIKTDSSGNILWTKNYRYNNFDTFTKIFYRLPNESFILAGNLLGFNPPYSGIFLAQFNQNFDLIWQTNYKDSSSNSLHDVVSINNNFFVSGGTHNGGPVSNYLVKFENGNFLWRKYTNTPYQKMIHHNGLIYCAGYSSFQIIDTSGFLHFNYPLNAGVIYGMEKIEDSKFVFLTPSSILKTDSTGSEIFRRYISASDSSSDQLFDLKKTNDSGFAITGMTSYGALWADDRNIFVIKTDAQGNSPPVSIKQISTQIPEAFTLYQNYPNPFNPSTKINFSIPRRIFVNLNVYDITGRLVKTLANETLDAGEYSVTLEGGDLPSGIYFYRIDAGSFSETKKMIMVK